MKTMINITTQASTGSFLSLASYCAAYADGFKFVAGRPIHMHLNAAHVIRYGDPTGTGGTDFVEGTFYTTTSRQHYTFEDCDPGRLFIRSAGASSTATFWQD